VIDLVERARGWLRDAARNRLVPAGDGFEPTRSPDTFGNLVYAPEAMIEKVIEHWNDQGGTAGSSVVAFDLLDDESKAEIATTGYSVRQAAFVQEDVFDQHKAVATVFNELAEKPEYKGQIQRRLFGLLLWAPERQISSRHFGELPETLAEFEEWAEELGFPLKAALAAYLANDLHLFGGVPIVLAVRRPQQVLGRESDIELLNFLISAGGRRMVRGIWPQRSGSLITVRRSPRHSPDRSPPSKPRQARSRPSSSGPVHSGRRSPCISSGAEASR
jgi:hypothetical protein